MVALVVIATEYATAVVGSLELLADNLRIVVGSIEYIEVLLSLEIDVLSRVGALLLVRAILAVYVVDTTLGCTLGHILGAEEVE